MKRNGLILFSILLTMPLFCQQPGDSLFGSSLVHEIRITFSQIGFWDSLTHNYEISNTQSQDIYIRGNITIDGNLLDSVGVRLKGNASYSNPGMKKSMKVSFNEYVSGQKYDGLKSIHLNNSAYDPTMLREKLMLDVLHRHHLDAPRCTFAAVYVNDGYVGLYKIIETIDKTYLQSEYGENNGNLFKGDPFGSLQWKDANDTSYYSDYELKTNTAQNNWSDLVDLIQRINLSGGDFPNSVEARFDVDEYLWTLAANNLFVNLDSYLYNPHNYYLYDDTLDGKFHWISWDVGLAFGVFPFWAQQRTTGLDVYFLPNSPEKVPLNQHLFEFPQYKQTYMNAMCTYMSEDFNPLTLFPKIDSLADRIRPYVYAEPDSNRMYTTTQFEGNLGFTSYSAWLASNIPGLKSFISDRRVDVASQLCSLKLDCSSGNGATPLSDAGLNVYPNPSTGAVTFTFDSHAEVPTIHFRIYDMMGQLLMDETSYPANGLYEKTVDFSTKPSGVYLIKLVSYCNDVEQKIVIVH